MKNDELLDNEEQNEHVENNVNEEAAEKETVETENVDKEADGQEDIDKESAENAADDKEAASEETEEQSALDKALDKIAELQDKYLRSVAEFDNYRKRTLKEKTELILNGSEKAVCAVLPVVDDIERAISNGQNTDDPEVLKEGMLLIYQKFEKVLESLGVKKIDTTDALFDVDIHEAVAMVPGMGDDKKGKVIDCIQTGYKLNDKVIRHAKVAVGQ
ncbi:MAG: nucleotide exchange factor GrpE [Prevotella sp.]|nr:nucleotide exchange factor GrpE [Prevotella sp.]